MVSKPKARSNVRNACSRESGRPTPEESCAEYSELVEPSLVRIASCPRSTPQMRVGLANISTR